MPTVYVTSIEPGAGKTGVAAAIARHYAYQGIPTKLVRFTGGDHAADDAKYFAGLFFVPGSPEAPVEPGVFSDPGSRDLAVVEGEPGDAPEGARVVLVGRGAAPAAPEGMEPAAIVVTRVASGDIESIPAEAGGAQVIALAEDRTLAGFTVSNVQRLLNAEVLVEAEPATTCDHLVIAPIGSDAGQPYFRRFERAAMVARYDKTDMQLAALRAQPVVLILTGGRRPSEYLFDAARAAEVPVLLSRTDTENTILALETVFDETRFEGEAKLDRMSELLEGANFADALALEVPAPT